MAEVLCVYRKVKLIKETAAAAKQKPKDKSESTVLRFRERCPTYP